MMGLPFARLAGTVTTLAVCWRITRPDGFTIGFTSHDQDMWLDGMWYRSRPGMIPSAIVSDSSLEPAEVEIGSVLDWEAVSAADLDAGRWADARFELFAMDWQAAADGRQMLMQGRLGDVVRDGDACGAFRVQLVDLRDRMAASTVPLCSPLCRAQLGDRHCGVDMAGRSVWVAVEQCGDREVVVQEAIADGGRYAYGHLRVMTGRQAGIDRRILTIAGNRIVVEECWKTDLAPGDVVRLGEGCDKRFSTCCERFSNGLNFDGEPHVPGTDALLRYGEL